MSSKRSGSVEPEWLGPSAGVRRVTGSGGGSLSRVRSATTETHTRDNYRSATLPPSLVKKARVNADVNPYVQFPSLRLVAFIFILLFLKNLFIN